MGRFYNGDINGKFWFAVQDSTAADRFGVEHSEPNYVEYHFNGGDLDSVIKELERIEYSIGADNIALMDAFFAVNTSYNDDIMLAFDERLPKLWDDHKTDYVDMELGFKIRDCIQEFGECSFSAEL